MATIALLGSGSWATALARLLALNGNLLRWWVRRPADAEVIARTGHNPRYLPQAQLPLAQVQLFANPVECVEGSQVVLCAIPSAYLAHSIAPLTAQHLQDKVILSAIKGLEATSGLEMVDYFTQRFKLGPQQYAFLTGPSHAEEVARAQVTYLTIACAELEVANHLAALVSGPSLYTVVATDVRGLEHAAVMKNIYALGIGISLGLGYGDNFIAVLVAACLSELQSYLQRFVPGGPRNITYSGYMGDLLVTAYSEHSRNRHLGKLIGTGFSPEAALQHMQMVAEGYYASRLMAEKTDPEHMPIAHAVYAVLHQQANAQQQFEALQPLFK